MQEAVRSMAGFGIMGSGANPDSQPRTTERRTVLAVGVLERDLAVSKGEQIATVDFDASAVCPRSRECPLGHSPVPMDKVARVAPVGIGKGCPDLSEASPHCLTAHVPGTADVRACGCFEDTVIAHERHEGIGIVAIPCIGKGL